MSDYLSTLKRPPIATSMILLAAVCIGVSWYIIWSPHQTTRLPIVIRENPKGYQFINPILFLSDGTKDNYPQYYPLRDSIQAQINQDISNGLATSMSVYFRDLSTDAWTGVNEADKYAPASMLKVAIMMAYLKLAETDPAIMTQQVYYKYADDPGQTFKPQPLSTGMHSIQELIENMIRQSDNTAETILSENILSSSLHSAFAQVFVDLHMPLPTATSSIDFLSPQQYSRLFRALYNSAYLPDPYSEYALQLLSQTDFPNGIQSAVPASTTVAHKFGERSVIASDGSVTSRELHDCGLIYNPGKVYFLCVMTRGEDFTSQEKAISDISKVVYKSVTKSQ